MEERILLFFFSFLSPLHFHQLLWEPWILSLMFFINSSPTSMRPNLEIPAEAKAVVRTRVSRIRALTHTKTHIYMDFLFL